MQNSNNNKKLGSFYQNLPNLFIIFIFYDIIFRIKNRKYGY